MSRPPPNPAAADGDRALPSGRLGIEPGSWVRHPGRPDWGTGQVQSVAGERLTVNFEHAGKVLVNARIIALQVLDGPPD